MATTKNPTAAAWGKVIRQQREQVTGESRAELAARVGVTPTMVGYWETGTHAPSSRMQATLMAKLGIDPTVVARMMLTAGDAA